MIYCYFIQNMAISNILKIVESIALEWFENITQEMSNL